MVRWYGGSMRGFPVGIWERGCEMWNVGGGR